MGWFHNKFKSLVPLWAISCLALCLAPLRCLEWDLSETQIKYSKHFNWDVSQTWFNRKQIVPIHGLVEQASSYVWQIILGYSVGHKFLVRFHHWLNDRAGRLVYLLYLIRNKILNGSLVFIILRLFYFYTVNL